ncbi:hypothetical protein N7530_010752 [Penicillium desertorum]|uniref:Uncharacterized protein n=1 Tax=Penicillium desertorum TaxID=1303715 RepID=A0A9X0BGT4_9EURO|nr:hypothetical protein N7530_010752 [Penicillium desertorum]
MTSKRPCPLLLHHKWWQDSNRLEEGSLVCFLTSEETYRRLIFLEVTMKNASKDRAKKLTGILVDFYSLIPATFAPILKNLQRIQCEGELAFQKWILPGPKDDKDGYSIPPPVYARKPGFVFPLTSIITVRAEKVILDPSTPESIDLLKLQTQTSLDHGQC